MPPVGTAPGASRIRREARPLGSPSLNGNAQLTIAPAAAIARTYLQQALAYQSPSESNQIHLRIRIHSSRIRVSARQGAI
jgi:hypothetical protein